MSLRTHYFLNFKVVISFLLILLTYFVYMDLALYYHVQALAPLPSLADMASESSPSISSFFKMVISRNVTNDNKLFSAFKGFTVKTLMLDHFSLYVFHVGGEIFNQITHFSKTFYFITPNMISAFHLMLAILAAKLVSSETLLIRQLGVLVFECRSFFDALDGMVARERMHQVQNISRFGSFGHFVDGLTDTLGVVALLVGVVCYLKNQSGAKIAYSLLPMWTKSGMNASFQLPSGITPSTQIPSTTNKKFFGVIATYGILLAISVLFWERYMSGYHKLLDIQPSTNHQAILQTEILKSPLMWSIMSCWRLSCCLALIQMLLISILLDKIWEFLIWIQYVGTITLFCVILVTEVHYRHARNYVGHLPENSVVIY